MIRKKVIVVEHIDESGIKLLENSNLVDILYFDGNALEDDVSKALEDASAIMVRSAPVTRGMMNNAQKLEIISKHGVGYDNIDVAAATELNIPVTITPEANSDSVAELAISMMLALARNLLRADADLKTGQFKKREDYTGVELGEKTLGIIGLGRIGSRVARRMSLGFKMRVLAYDPFISVEYAAQFNAELLEELDALLTASDVVTIHAPLTELTKNMIAEKQFRKMKQDAFIINTARGGIVNEADLFRALTENWIRGAGLDVFVKEPPHPKDNPLLGLQNVIVTPHLGSGAKESLMRMATHAAEEIIRVLSGKQPKHPVNPEIYD
ncbi:MAG: hydroxyacid dehydrogenase [Deltaproteobacteria bacterium]|nr:hydroxyacid dehydrogenase [Deltaproteobacteria bacterium]